jgi:hypothetical protein
MRAPGPGSWPKVRRVLPEPPLGQVGAGEERRSRFALNVVEEAGERADTPWPPDDAGMKADGHELGGVVALSVERVEGVTKVFERTARLWPALTAARI